MRRRREQRVKASYRFMHEARVAVLLDCGHTHYLAHARGAPLITTFACTICNGHAQHNGDTDHEQQRS